MPDRYDAHAPARSPRFAEPDARTPGQRWLAGVFRTVLWALWAYLWVPLVTVFAWWLGYESFAQDMGLFDDAAAVFDLLKWYVVVAVLLAGVLFACAAFQRGRSRHSGRSRDFDPSVGSARS